jgi:hypothetical protein
VTARSTSLQPPLSPVWADRAPDRLCDLQRPARRADSAPAVSTPVFEGRMQERRLALRIQEPRRVRQLRRDRKEEPSGPLAPTHVCPGDTGRAVSHVRVMPEAIGPANLAIRESRSGVPDLDSSDPAQGFRSHSPSGRRDCLHLKARYRVLRVSCAGRSRQRDHVRGLGGSAAGGSADTRERTPSSRRCNS